MVIYLSDFQKSYALVAQLDRAFGYEPKGRGFKSLRAYHISLQSKQQNKTVARCRGFVYKKAIHLDCFFWLLYLNSYPPLEILFIKAVFLKRQGTAGVLTYAVLLVVHAEDCIV